MNCEFSIFNDLIKVNEIKQKTPLISGVFNLLM